jgi:hypothetical protein
LRHKNGGILSWGCDPPEFCSDVAAIWVVGDAVEN